MSDYMDWLRSFDEIEDNDKAAVAAVDDLGRLNQRARSLLLPILGEALLMARRSATRRVERTTPISAVFDGETSLDRRQARLAATFPLPDGRRVSWLEATEADHQARIDYLRMHIAGVERTIGEHEDAVAAIREHGVACLAEIEGAA